MSTATTETGSVVLEARGLAKSYGAVKALDGVDLELRRGEVLGLVGDNGAARSGSRPSTRTCRSWTRST